MTAILENGYTVEIIEQLASGLWMVRVQETGQTLEISEEELFDIEY